MNKVRARLKGAIENRLKDTGETWDSIQKIKLKKVWVSRANMARFTEYVKVTF